MNEQGLRVAIVDDVPVIRTVLSGSLERGGFQVVGIARNGQEIVDKVVEWNPQIVLLDVVMPVMQGYEALPLIKEKCPNTLVIMLTSTSERSLVLMCKERGADGFIIKQDGLAEVLPERLRTIWNNKRDSLARPGE